MKLSLNTLPKGRSEQIFDSVAQLQQDESIEWQATHLELKLRIDRQIQNFYLHGSISCTGKFICEAGMEMFEDTLQGDFDIILTYDSKQLNDYENEDVFLIPGHQTDFDLYPIVRDSILLAIPISHVCGPDCEAGKALRKRMQPQEEFDDRWAKLKDMFNE